MDNKNSSIEIVIYENDIEIARETFRIHEHDSDDIIQFFDETNTFENGARYEINVDDLNGEQSIEENMTVSDDEYSVSDVMDFVNEKFDELSEDD